MTARKNAEPPSAATCGHCGGAPFRPFNLGGMSWCAGHPCCAAAARGKPLRGCEHERQADLER